MPDPKENENLEAFLERCIPMVMEDGSAEGNDQAVAMCHGMWTKAKKSIKAESLEKQQEDMWRAFQAQFDNHHPMPMPEMGGWLAATYDDHVIASFGEEYYKIPYTRDGTEITFAERDQWTLVEKTEPEWVEKVNAMKIARREDVSAADLSDVLVTFGEPVKSLGGGRFGGYLVRFSTAEDPDITADFFTPDTDYDMEFPGKSSHYYHHGLDVKFGKRKIGTVVLSKDDVGVWAEAIVKARDEYEEMLVKLAGEGKLGWSSGTATHLVERKPAGKATQITKWPLGLDASWTPTPAEPRNQVIPLKSLMGDIADSDETMDVETVETVTQEVEPLPAAKQIQLKARAFDWL